MKKVLLAIAAVIFAALAFATLACAEAVNDEIFILDFDAGDKPKGTELPLWGENGECLVWYLDSENKLVCATTAELTYGYTEQTQGNTQPGYGSLPTVSNASALSSISIGETVLQDTNGTKKIVVANLHDVDFDYIYTNGGSIFANNNTLQCLYLPDDIVRLPDRVLYGATHLTKFDMGESVVVIWFEAFQNCSAIERVDFSDTCMYFPPYAFKNCTSLKEVYLGKSIKYFQKDFLNGTGTQMIDLYVPSTVEWAKNAPPYNNYLTIFYTGTLEQAQKNLNDFGGVVKYTYISYDDFDGTRTTEQCKWYCYYDVSPCVAYDKGVHEFGPASYAYPNGFDKAGAKITACTKEGCNVQEKTELAPLFEAIGYSIKDDGTAILGGFKLNPDAIKTYNEHIVAKGKDALSYGILVTNKNPGEGGVVVENGQLTSSKGVMVDINNEDLEYSFVNYSLSGFVAEKKFVDAEFIISFFVQDGDKASFIQSETATSQQQITCEGKGVELNTISLRTLAEKEIVSLNAELEATSDEKRKEKIRTTIENLTVFTSVE